MADQNTAEDEVVHRQWLRARLDQVTDAHAAGPKDETFDVMLEALEKVKWLLETE